jgi:hypothetical protein
VAVVLVMVSVSVALQWGMATPAAVGPSGALPGEDT